MKVNARPERLQRLLLPRSAPYLESPIPYLLQEVWSISQEIPVFLQDPLDQSLGLYKFKNKNLEECIYKQTQCPNLWNVRKYASYFVFISDSSPCKSL